MRRRETGFRAASPELEQVSGLQALSLSRFQASGKRPTLPSDIADRANAALPAGPRKPARLASRQALSLI